MSETNLTYEEEQSEERKQRALAEVEQMETHARLLRQFIERNLAPLAGLCWRVSVYRPEITIDFSWRGTSKIQPREIAARWPAGRWVRKAPHHGGRSSLDWCAEMEGVTVRIDRAEKFAPPPEGEIDFAALAIRDLRTMPA